MKITPDFKHYLPQRYYAIQSVIILYRCPY